jgi:hypothetical protein
MDCPCCGKGCVRYAEDVLADIDRMYLACPDCATDPNLDKGRPLKDLPQLRGRCKSCSKAPLDEVMRDALNVLVEKGLRDEADSLRSVGSPLIVVGYPLAYPPRLERHSLIIAGERLNKNAAEAILSHVPEVKGVILIGGVPGVVDSDAEPREWSLLAGCDMRGDVVQSVFGELVIYRSQSKIHIEFPRQNTPKMKILEELYFQGMLNDVVDGLCGPGTLGLMCVLAGAKRVAMNDIWLPAIENVMLNLEANKGLLGIDKIDHLEHPVKAVASEPVLVGRATGACNIEVYHSDIKRLFSKSRPASLCLIDHFPGSDTRGMEEAAGFCKKIIIV